jgi:hypothetical protein
MDLIEISYILALFKHKVSLYCIYCFNSIMADHFKL